FSTEGTHDAPKRPDGEPGRALKSAPTTFQGTFAPAAKQRELGRPATIGTPVLRLRQVVTPHRRHTVCRQPIGIWLDDCFCEKIPIRWCAPELTQRFIEAVVPVVEQLLRAVRQRIRCRPDKSREQCRTFALEHRQIAVERSGWAPVGTTAQTVEQLMLRAQQCSIERDELRRYRPRSRQ